MVVVECPMHTLTAVGQNVLLTLYDKKITIHVILHFQHFHHQSSERNYSAARQQNYKMVKSSIIFIAESLLINVSVTSVLNQQAVK